MTLADPAQILGLSPYSRDATRSWDPVKAAQFPKVSGEAKDVLVLKPDVVVAGRYTKRATRELLKQKGLRVAAFDAARSLDDVKKQIRQMGDLVQHPDRADAEISGWMRRSHMRAKSFRENPGAYWRCRGAAGFPAATA